MGKMSKSQLLEVEALAYIEGDKSAVDRIYPLVDKMVWDIARKYGKDNWDKIEEYHQYGWCGVMKALNSYNPDNEKKAKFITLCHICITQAIIQEWRQKKKHENEYDEDGNAIRVHSSLDARVSEDGLTLGEYIASDALPLDEYVISEWEKQFIQEQLKLATPQDREIIRLMILGVPQAEIGKQVGLQQCRVSRHYRNFIRKCQKNADSLTKEVSKRA